MAARLGTGLKRSAVSVVIPCRNRLAKLGETLRGLADQAPTSEGYEIIVVDDGSAVPLAVEERGHVHTRWLRLEGVGRSAARNAGATAAAGELLIFVDDDISVRPDFVEQHLAAHRRWPGSIVVGPIRLPPESLRTPFGRFRQSLEDAGIPTTAGPHDDSNFCAAGNMSIAKAQFLELGGFDTTLDSAEDQDLARRLGPRGGRLVFWPEAGVVHRDDALDIRSYCRRSEWGMEQMVPFCGRYPETREAAERARTNGPTPWGDEPRTLSIKKAIKEVLSRRSATELLFAAASLTERVGSEAMCGRLYRLLLGVHLQRGWRNGLPKRLLHFAEDGDTSGYFPQLARHYDRNRYTMTFGTLKPMAPWLKTYMESQGVRTLSLDCSSRRAYPAALLRLARFLRKERIDILHTHLFDPSVVGLAAGLLARTPARVMTRHYSDYHTRIAKRWHTRLDRFCTDAAHAVIAVSEHTAQHLVAIEKAPRAKIRTILNGIDFDRVHVSGTEAPAQIRREYAGEAAKLLLVAARFHPEKGYEHLFAALPEIRRRLDGNVRLLIAGTGSLESDYRARVRALGCEDIVHFLGFRRDLPDLMAAADLFVLPSVAEAFGLVLAEALYLGTPVVATRTGGIPEIVTDGVDGALVPPANSAALAETISGLLADDVRRNQMRGRGRDTVVQRFRFDPMLTAYEAVYDEVLTNHRTGA